jgi:hypothetical protein
MTRDDITRMAREAGFTVVDSVDPQCWAGDHAADDESLERFFKLAYEAGAKDEREACARVCEDIDPPLDSSTTAMACAAAIRARGQPDPKVTHLNEWARDRLARHGINPCPDCHGIGYDASGQLCACRENPSF